LTIITVGIHNYIYFEAESNIMTKLLHLISGPRNISTALMYSFGNRADSDIVDEPFYAYYLDKFDVTHHPGRKEILDSLSTDAIQVVDDLHQSRAADYLFVKNMAHHLRGFDYSFALEAQNIFLIRDPSKLIASFAKVISQPSANDIGLIREVELYDELSQSGKHTPIVIDSGELLLNPPQVIGELCRKLDIPMDKGMLEWKAGPREADGVWAPYWYANVHKTIGFSKKVTTPTKLTGHLQKLYEEVLPYYDKLYALAIKAEVAQ